jgi:hypothetical protein
MRTKQLLVLALLVGVLAPIVLWVRAVAGIFRQTPEPLTSLEEATKVTGVAFPPGCTLIDGQECRCWNAYLYARIRIPPYQVPRLWKAPPFRGECSATEDAMAINLPPEVRRGWRLDRVKDFRSSGGGDLYAEGASQALVSLDNPSDPVLYLYWFHN